MDFRIISNIIFWAGALTTGFVWFFELGDAQNTVFALGLIATVVGALLRTGEFSKSKSE